MTKDGAMTEIKLHNTKTRMKERFAPADPRHVKLYLCGPTVYDRAHLGNARPVVVFDVLVRLMRRLYPLFTYVRNITDVDDKINARAAETGESIEEITARTIAWYEADMAALFALPPDIEPRVTRHIPQIITLIERLIALGHAYAAAGHVLFSVASDPDYGKFSGRSPDELLAGARVDVAAYKRDAGDFVLWKPSSADLPGWDSPWGRGRPGWHIECSAMIWKHLGESIDIHGGGTDLIFPHHENEIAQSCCAFPGSGFARFWVHNGMVTVNGEKMSKSLGNFRTVQDVLAQAPAEAVRFLLLKTHYRSPLDFTDAGLAEAQKELIRFYGALQKQSDLAPSKTILEEVLKPLTDDLNTPEAIAEMHKLANRAWAGDVTAAADLKAAGEVLGLFNPNLDLRLKPIVINGDLLQDSNILSATAFLGEASDTEKIEMLVTARIVARKRKDYAEADRLRREIESFGISIEDGPGGVYTLRKL
jgi:cysteinyl-tRNA synthetase